MGLIYDTAVLGTPNNFITFNNFQSSPVYQTVRRGTTRREIREYDIPLPETQGVADFQTFIGKEYFIIEGVMYPGSEAEFYSAREDLRKLSSLEIEQNDSSSDAGYVPYQWSEGPVAKQQMVKILYIDMDEAARQGIVQPFKIFCKVKYPIITGQQPVTATLNSAGASIATNGGGVWPATWPMAWGATGNVTGTVLPVVLPVVIGASAATGGGTVTNIGDIPAWPTIVIYGPVNKPKITNLITGEYLEIDYNLASTSNTMILSYDQDSLSFTADNMNVYGKLTSGSRPWRVQPGINNFNFSGSSLGVGAMATVSFFPTWPIS